MQVPIMPVVVMVMPIMMMSMVVLAGPSDMVMVAHLRQSHRLFKPWQLHPVLAEFAVHIWTALYRFLRALDKDIEEQGMRVEIIGTQKFSIRMLGRKL